MLIEKGVVVRVEANSVWVKTRRLNTCGNCHSRHGCGQNLLQRMVSDDADIKARLDRSTHLPNSSAHLTSEGEIRPGDEVEIAIEEGAVVAASVLAYGLPLICLILGVVVAESWMLGEWMQLLLGLSGLAAGLCLSRAVLFGHFKPAYFEPFMLRRSTAPAIAPYPRS